MTQNTSENMNTSKKEPIAIIGIGCRFSGGANSPEAFWKLLRDGVDAITEVPSDRWNLDNFYDPEGTKPGKIRTRWGGFVDKIDEFDADFFGISPREASCMDPQQRLLLEVAWEALEDRGQVPENLAGSKTGVFIGISSSDYHDIQLSVSDRDSINAYTNLGGVHCVTANRISYILNFKGPSMAVDTACSSGLVAVHLACQSIWNGESALAIAGGVNAMLKPEITIGFSKASMLSPDGRCKTFDERANGYVRAEGAGVVLLKPLSQALADKDPIYAVIRGSTVNQDGQTNGISVPNGLAQEAAVREACKLAGISPEQIQYVEAHGTGTPVGDPIEANALGNAIGKNRPAGDYCTIGSVKSNIGHLESASGIAGLIKLALALKYRQIPPSLHFETPNPKISFEELRLRVPTALEPWPNGKGPRLAGINSFGFGRTNAHVAIAETPENAGVGREKFTLNQYRPSSA
jgi:myxalamid-type polyketide synthase MxaB